MCDARGRDCPCRHSAAVVISRAVDLRDRVALVAGGTGVLGTAIARALARAGADVAFTYLERQDAARESGAAVEALGRRAWSIALDQTDADAIPAAVEAVAGHFGRLDALVNNAGWNISIPFPDLDTLDAKVWDRLFSTNLRGPYLLVRAAARHLKASGAGRVVNIASVAGLHPRREQHRLRDKQGGHDPPDAVPGGGPRPRGDGELRGPRAHGGDADDLAAPA
jgi:NAD(P)-dependent dehydrogenase (short-subunit alcohol dehydrogenase family)